jgi:general nucleoside transport system permease protein
VLASWKSRGTLVTALTSVLAVAVALAVGALFILLSRQNPIDAYRALIEGAFGSRRAIGETLAASTPFIFGGLAFAVAYRAGLFNIGIEGQMIMGGLAAGLFAAWNLDLPKVIYLPMALLVAAIAGGLWGAIAGALKAISGAHEVITTIMLNYLAFQIVNYAVLRADSWLPVNPQLQSTDPAAADARLPNILSGTRLHAGLLLGLLMAVLIWYLLFRTTFGYRLRTVGLSKGAAAYAGMSWGVTITIAMFISGALGGLGGSSETLGLRRCFSAPCAAVRPPCKTRPGPRKSWCSCCKGWSFWRSRRWRHPGECKRGGRNDATRAWMNTATRSASSRASRRKSEAASREGPAVWPISSM